MRPAASPSNRTTLVMACCDKLKIAIIIAHGSRATAALRRNEIGAQIKHGVEA